MVVEAESGVITLSQHIIDKQQGIKGATGEFSWLLGGITLATKIIEANVRRAGLVNILGDTGAVNVQGELVQKLDRIANETIQQCLGFRETWGSWSRRRTTSLASSGRKAPRASTSCFSIRSTVRATST